jgi:serine/threonine protein kinase
MALDESTTAFSFRGSGTRRWMSPERLNAEISFEETRPTKASDCYALGMVIYEVLSGRVPFVAPMKALGGKRPIRPQGKRGTLFTDDIWDMLELCWKQQPRDRISASAVLLRLEKHPPLPMLSPDVGGDAESGSDESVIDSIARLYVFPASF